MVRAKTLLLSALVLAMSCASATAYPNPGTVVGGTLIHDPSMLVRNLNNPPCTCLGAPRYIVYGTNNITLVSNDRIDFEYGPPAFVTKPGWWSDYNNNFWAPDVSFHNGNY